MSTDPNSAGGHLARAETLVRELEDILHRSTRHASTSADRFNRAAVIAQLHVGIARCLAEIQVAETHVALADMLTAYSLDSHDVEDKDHGPESWPPIQT